MKYNKQTFITVPNRCSLQSVSGHAQLVFMWLCDMQNSEGVSFPSHQKLSDLTRFSKATIKRAIQELTEYGLIEKTNRYKGKEQITNEYQVLITDTEPCTPQLSESSPQLSESSPQLSESYRTKPTKPNPLNHASGDGASSDADDSSLNKTEIKPRKSSAPNPTINALHYQVIKKYALPVSNHNEVSSKSKHMEQEIGYDKAIAYLQSLLDNDYESVTGKFKPSLNHSRDIYDKRKKIEVFLYENTNRYL